MTQLHPLQVFDVDQIRKDFPALATERNGRPPIYLDNACATIPCQQVIDTLNDYSIHFPSCGDRSPHYWGKKVDHEVARSRDAIARFINASDPDQIIFTKNTTESLNLVARGLHWERGDVVVNGDREHNSNRTVWVDISRESGIQRKVISRDGTESPHAEFDVDYFLGELRTIDNIKMVSMTMSSNLDGNSISASDIRKVCDYAHSEELQDELQDFYVMLDCAQIVPHKPVDVQAMDVDFMAFSVHKMCGPTGLGVCYMKDPDILERGLVSGGGTVANTFDDGRQSIYLRSPHKYEAGLQHWSGIIAARSAVKYLEDKIEDIPAHVLRLNEIVTEALLPCHEKEILTILGPLDPAKRGSICTFEVHPQHEREDMGRFFLETVMGAADEYNMMFRAGDFCVSPYCRQIRGEKVARIRLSFYLYNTEEESRLAAEMFRRILDERA